jgi:hypothetical protein
MAMPTFSSDVIFTNKPDRGENNHSFTREISAYPELGVGISLLTVSCALLSYQAASRKEQERREDEIGSTNALQKRKPSAAGGAR